MDYGIYIITFLIILSKYADCHTTATQISAIHQERNPLARKLMHKFGIQPTIWGIFLLSIVITLLSLWLLVAYFNSHPMKLLYILFGALTTIIQFAVAHTNQTKRLNRITRFLLHSRNATSHL
jgi:hypothetical protein